MNNFQFANSDSTDATGSRSAGVSPFPGSLAPGGAQQALNSQSTFPNSGGGAQQNTALPGHNNNNAGTTHRQVAQPQAAVPTAIPNPAQFATNRTMSFPGVGFDPGISPTTQTPYHFSMSGAPGQTGNLGQLPQGSSHPGGNRAYVQPASQLQANNPNLVPPMPQIPMPTPPAAGLSAAGQLNILSPFSMPQTPFASQTQSNIAAQRTPNTPAGGLTTATALPTAVPGTGSSLFGQNTMGTPSALTRNGSQVLPASPLNPTAQNVNPTFVPNLQGVEGGNSTMLAHPMGQMAPQDQFVTPNAILHFQYASAGGQIPSHQIGDVANSQGRRVSVANPDPMLQASVNRQLANLGALGLTVPRYPSPIATATHAPTNYNQYQAAFMQIATRIHEWTRTFEGEPTKQFTHADVDTVQDYLELFAPIERGLVDAINSDQLSIEGLFYTPPYRRILASHVIALALHVCVFYKFFPGVDINAGSHLAAISAELYKDRICLSDVVLTYSSHCSNGSRVATSNLLSALHPNSGRGTIVASGEPDQSRVASFVSSPDGSAH
jgi:hypothetical protein